MTRGANHATLGTTSGADANVAMSLKVAGRARTATAPVVFHVAYASLVNSTSSGSGTVPAAASSARKVSLPGNSGRICSGPLSGSETVKLI